MEIIKLKIEDIIPYDKNAKEHTHYHIEQIKESIERFGFNDPIAVDENNVVIEGHGRLEALKELGYEEVEVIKLTHLTEDQKRTYIIAHNKLTLNSSFDMEILEEELRKTPDDLLSTTGFEDFEISSILGYEGKISEDMDEEPKSSN
ncbi:MAG TPA: ParB/Srx family N-terminal domain-containing protein, partial [Spirochaetota bacterium]|nr:ParB/Srx family N-terminal domain-containing protein [Spirochaetota bacterium]